MVRFEHSEEECMKSV